MRSRTSASAVQSRSSSERSTVRIVVVPGGPEVDPAFLELIDDAPLGRIGLGDIREDGEGLVDRVLIARRSHARRGRRWRPWRNGRVNRFLRASPDRHRIRGCG